MNARSTAGTDFVFSADDMAGNSLAAVDPLFETIVQPAGRALQAHFYIGKKVLQSGFRKQVVVLQPNATLEPLRVYARFQREDITNLKDFV